MLFDDFKEEMTNQYGYHSGEESSEDEVEEKEKTSCKLCDFKAKKQRRIKNSHYKETQRTIQIEDKRLIQKVYGQLWDYRFGKEKLPFKAHSCTPMFSYVFM